MYMCILLSLNIRKPYIINDEIMLTQACSKMSTKNDKKPVV